MAPPPEPSSERPRRRSERQFVAGAAAAPPPPKTLRRRSKTDPTVKPLLFWTPEEIVHLVAAWRHTIAHPPARPRKTAGGFNTRMYARFVELVGGATRRAKASMVAKKQLLLKSFEFIYAYGEKRRAGDGGANHWFELSRAQRKALGDKAMLGDQRAYALLCMDQATYASLLEISMFEGELSVRSPWTEDEVDLLLRAWREAITKHGRGKQPKKVSSINMHIYQVMQALCDGGVSKRTKQAVVLKKEALRCSADLIAAHNKESREARDLERATSGGAAAKLKSTAPATWFSLSAREQERVVARKFPRTGFVYLSETQFCEVEFLGKETDRLYSAAGGRQGHMWTHDENVVLVQAWRETVARPVDELPPNVALGACVFERFVELTGGAYSRSERSAIHKLLALENMHKFISDYNSSEAKRNWFVLGRPERKRIHFEATKADDPIEHRSNTFTDIDKSTFDDVTAILARNRSVEEVANAVDTPEKQEPPRKKGKKVRGDDDDDDDDDDESENEDEEEDDDDGEEEDGEEEDTEDKANVVGKVEESSSSGDDGSESENELIRWKPRAAALNKKQPQSAPSAGRGGRRAAKGVVASGSSQTAAAAAGDPNKKTTTTLTPQASSFLQPSMFELPLHSSSPAASRAIVDHQSIFGDDTPDNSSDDSSSDDDKDNGFVSSSSAHLKPDDPASKKLKPSKQNSASSLFSLHELADLAMRVNDPVESGDQEGSASAHEGDASSTLGTQQSVPPATRESAPPSRLSPEVAAIVQILHTQSEQLICVMGEIRDELKRDREERKRLRREMQRDRERRGRSSDDDDDDESDDSESESEPRRKRARGDTKDRPGKKKASRRLSVQRDGFVVRL